MVSSDYSSHAHYHYGTSQNKVLHLVIVGVETLAGVCTGIVHSSALALRTSMTVSFRGGGGGAFKKISPLRNENVNGHQES